MRSASAAPEDSSYSMDSDRWKRAREVIECAMELPRGARLQFVQSSVSDESLRGEILKILSHADDASAVLKNNEWSSAPCRDEPDLRGTVLGNYRLISELGRGGMGAVYLAERADGLYNQQVALKLLQAAITSKRLVERFWEERNILARLKHPGIARLIDGGVTADGRPYFVLELVKGVAIDSFCENAHLNLDERIKLFLKVADAVQAAHEQFVLHLDIKPANILVDESGEPHLLDFGIAQSLGTDEGIALASDETSRLLTPRYASPEQISGQPLSVASDVFSLATLLYVLLTGKLPYPIEKATGAEVSRIVRTEAAVPPSTMAPRALRAKLRGDLDVILLQALRKEAGSRYPTVAAMSADLQRYLASEPVSAHPQSITYWAGKFVRRNRFYVSAAAIALGVLVVSGAAVVRSAVVARRQQAIAEKRLSDVRDLAHSYVFDLDSMLEQVPGTIHIRHFVLQKAQKYLETTSAELGNDEYLEKEIAEGYLQIGRVQALPGLPSMSDWRAAATSQAKGVAIQRKIVAHHPNDPSALNELLRHLINEVQVYQTVGDLEHVQRTLEEEWQISQPLIAGGPKGVGYSRVPIVAWSIAILHCGNGDDWNLADPVGSLPWLQRTEDLAQHYLQENPRGKYVDLARAMLERVAINRAYLAEHSERPGDARTFYDRAMSLTSGTDLVEVETRKQLRGFYADYLLSLGDANGAAKMAPRPEKEASVHERGKDRLLTADEADELQLLGRIDMGLGKVAEGRRKIESSLKAYDALFSTLPEDSALSSSVAHSHFDYAEEPLAPPPVRFEQYHIAIRTAQDFAKRSPMALSTSLFIGRCYMGLAMMKTSSKQYPEKRRFAGLAAAEFRKVLSAYSEQPEASRFLHQAEQLAE